MIAFFYVTEDTEYLIEEPDHSLTQKLLAPTGELNTDRIYFTTPSDLQRKMELKDNIVIVKPSELLPSLNFPKHIGFMEFNQVLEELKDKTHIKIAVINGMSLAFGDHLIGMQSFDYWHKEISKHFDEVEVTFFQFDPYKLYPITKNWYPSVSKLVTMPNTVSSLLGYDAFITLGSMLVRETFDEEPMVDFFLRALSLDPAKVPCEAKRIKYEPTSTTLNEIEAVLRKVRFKKRPILLFHHKSTATIREMSKVTARRLVREILQHSNYFIVSAVPLEYQHPRFLDISRFSKSFEHFASIISKVDAVVTVDTVTYHVADAFDVPTVAIFTSISPDLRVRYYPRVKSIMLENTKGMLYGRHKQSVDKEVEEIQYVENLWAGLNGSTILEVLDSVKREGQ